MRKLLLHVFATVVLSIDEFLVDGYKIVRSNIPLISVSFYRPAVQPENVVDLYLHTVRTSLTGELLQLPATDRSFTMSKEKYDKGKGRCESCLTMVGTLKLNWLHHALDFVGGDGTPATRIPGVILEAGVCWAENKEYEYH